MEIKLEADKSKCDWHHGYHDTEYCCGGFYLNNEHFHIDHDFLTIYINSFISSINCCPFCGEEIIIMKEPTEEQDGE